MTDNDRRQYVAARALIAKSRSILVSGHVSPDGDSAGCMVALVRMLRSAGKKAVAAADRKSLGKLVFLEGAKDMVSLRLLKKKRFDLFIAADCASFERLPPEVRAAADRLPCVCFDHHATGDENFGDARIVDSTASSASEIVWRFAKWMEWSIDSAAAEALWTGIVTDTGRFAWESTSPGTMRAAGDLLKRGVRTAEINDIIYGAQTRKSIELKKRAWRSLHIWKNGKVAEVSLGRDDFRQTHATKADAEDVIEIPRSVAGCRIALFFHQIPDRTKETRCSIRTRGDLDATELAGKFGGGGHRKAAGCTIAAPLAAAKRKMREAVKELLK